VAGHVPHTPRHVRHRSDGCAITRKVNREEGEPWDAAPGSDLFYPFVRVEMDRGITTVFGANEAGKSQLIGAVKRLLTGDGIVANDFCRYSEFLKVDGQMLLPEFGAEFTDLADDEKQTVRTLAGIAEGAPVSSFWFFRLNNGPGRCPVTQHRHGRARVPAVMPAQPVPSARWT
jgi:hypothetical protein